MVASITHELNNPLQSIKNCLYLTQEELGETNEHQFLGLAMQEVNRLAAAGRAVARCLPPAPIAPKMNGSIWSSSGAGKGPGSL